MQSATSLNLSLPGPQRLTRRSALPLNSARVPRRPREHVKTQAVFGLFGGGGGSVEDKKNKLLAAIAPLDRGYAASDAEKAEIDALCKALERVNPNKASLSADEINGKWELLYTTSDSILGRSKGIFRPSGPIYQTIDARTLRVKNQENAPLFNAVDAELEPLSKSKVKVQFKKFYIGSILPITAPGSARGELDTTFVDDTLRISRGDKGNLFVLRMADPNATLKPL